MADDLGKAGGKAEAYSRPPLESGKPDVGFDEAPVLTGTYMTADEPGGHGGTTAPVH